MKLLLAGMENSLNMAIKHEIKDILVSALYMSKKKASMDAVLTNFDFVFLDSGAFTYWNKWEMIQEKAIGTDKFNDEKFLAEWHKSEQAIALFNQHKLWGKQWEEQYLAMLKSDKRFLNRDIVHVVEFDIGNEEEMTERRTRFEKAGFNVVPVFHPRDSQGYKDMLMRDYDYIGIGGIAIDGGKFRARDFQQHFKTLKANQTKVHGFGMTQQEPMRKMPFYSVDSTSWLSGARYGVTFEFRNGQLKTHVEKDVRKRFKRMCEELKVDYKGLLADDGKTVNEWNMLQWKMYADWLTLSPMKKKQEYWHDRIYGGEVQKIITRDFDAGTQEVRLLNGKGEPYNAEDYVVQKNDEEEYEEEEIERVEAEEVLAGEIEGAEGSTALIGIEDKPMTMKQKKLELITNGQFMECDSCTLGDRCPLYKEGKLCGIPLQEVKGGQDFGQVMEFLFNLQRKRLSLGALQESADGGILDERLSKEMDRMMGMMFKYNELVHPTDSVEIKAKGSGSGGILAQIFGLGKQE